MQAAPANAARYDELAGDRYLSLWLMHLHAKRQSDLG
jgi:hypothetical protein